MITPSVGPVYRAIADDLRQRITGGEFQPSGNLPSEAHLEQRYGVSQTTIRRALDVLVHEGLVTKRHGAPTRVRDTPDMTVVELPPGYDVIARPATGPERAEWGLPPGGHLLVALERGTGVEWHVWAADRTRLRPNTA